MSRTIRHFRASVLMLLAVLAFFASGCAHSAPRQEAGTETAIVLHQKDYYRGPVDVVITASALRMNLNGGVTYLVARAPLWRVVFYNKRDRVGMDMPMADYLLHYPKWWPFERSRPAGIKFPPMEKVGCIDYAGKSCLKFGQLDLSRNGQLNPQRRYQALHYVWSDKRIPVQVCQILGTLVGDTKLPGVRLYQENLQIAKQKKTTGRDLVALFDVASSPPQSLTTTKIEESAKFPSSYFDYPAKFKRVQAEMDVWTDSDKQRQGEDLFKDMKLGE